MKYNFRFYFGISAAVLLLYLNDAYAVESTLKYQCCTSPSCSATSMAMCTSTCSHCYNVVPPTDLYMCSLKSTWYAAGTKGHTYGYYVLKKPDYTGVDSLSDCTYSKYSEVACAAGYYVYRATICKKCPDGFTSADKNTADGTADGVTTAGDTNGVEACYKAAGTSYTGDKGTYSYESACYCDDSCEDDCNPDSSLC